jgi:hypothetical protein
MIVIFESRLVNALGADDGDVEGRAVSPSLRRYLAIFLRLVDVS